MTEVNSLYFHSILADTSESHHISSRQKNPRRESARAAAARHVARYSRVIGCQQEVEQQADGVLHGDLVGGGHALVQLVKNGGQHHF